MVLCRRATRLRLVGPHSGFHDLRIIPTELWRKNLVMTQTNIEHLPPNLPSLDTWWPITPISLHPVMRTPNILSNETMILQWITKYAAVFEQQPDEPNIFNSPPLPPPNTPQTEPSPKIGSTIRIIQESISTLLSKPLPSSILSERIQLELFPATSRHAMPVIRGKRQYRMLFQFIRSASLFDRAILRNKNVIETINIRAVTLDAQNQIIRFVVKWSIPEKPSTNLSSPSASTTSSSTLPPDIALAEPSSQRKARFAGWFKFDIDKEGKIIRHVVESIDESNQMLRVNESLQGWVAQTLGLGDKKPSVACWYGQPRAASWEGVE